MKIEIKFTDGSGKVHEYIVDDSLISSKAIQAEAERYQQTTANNDIGLCVRQGFWERICQLKNK